MSTAKTTCPTISVSYDKDNENIKNVQAHLSDIQNSLLP
jgi:hypothetical protein